MSCGCYEVELDSLDLLLRYDDRYCVALFVPSLAGRVYCVQYYLLATGSYCSSAIAVLTVAPRRKFLRLRSSLNASQSYCSQYSINAS